MNVKLKNVFSLVKDDTEYFHNNVDKIKMEKCPLEKQKCTSVLVFVNQSYVQPNRYFYDINFHGAIEQLKNAFYKTLELDETSCKKCTDFFRLTIIESLEVIKDELGKMSKGLFKTNRYQSNYNEACKVLKEFQEFEQNNILKLNKHNNYSLNHHDSKCVS